MEIDFLDELLKEAEEKEEETEAYYESAAYGNTEAAGSDRIQFLSG